MGNSRIKNKKEEILLAIEQGTAIKDLSIKYGYKRVCKFKEQLIKEGLIPDKNGNYINNKKKYVCKYCGKVFDTNQKLGGHINFCDLGPHKDKNLENLEKNRAHIDNKRWEAVNLKCHFCGKEVHNPGCLVLHEKHCKFNPNRVPKNNGGKKGKSHPAWNKGKTSKDDYRILKSSISRKKSIENGTYVPHRTPHTEESKRIMREKMIDYIKSVGNGKFGQHFSKKACNYIDKLNEQMGWNLQHALNGGEREVFGYFLDGYDEEKNIAFEYDEPRHYLSVHENILKKRDIKRQQYIIDKLGCEFYRYNEKLDLLYKI